MNRKERLRKLLSILASGEIIANQELARQLQVSAGTVRRDLVELEQENKLKRVHGGAVIVSDSPLAMPISLAQTQHTHSLEYALPYEFAEKLQQESEAKHQIAREAAKLIQDYDSVFIESGSTTYYMLDYIMAQNITVITNGLPHLLKLAEKKINTYVLEGFANQKRGVIMLTEPSLALLSKINFSKAFIGTLAVDFKLGYTTASMKDAGLKKSIIQSVPQIFILADHTKYGKRSMFTFAEAAQATLIGDQIPENAAIPSICVGGKPCLNKNVGEKSLN